MQAIILAAGMGKRLKDLTQNNTKCMVKVNGVTLIERMLHQIDAVGVDTITLVVGYEGRKLMDYISTLDINTPIEYIDNPVYDSTNNIYSLSLASELLTRDDTLLFESDIIFEDAALKSLVEDSRPNLALVDKYEPWMDGTCVTLNEDDSIATFVPKRLFDYSLTDEYYKTVNIYKFSSDFAANYYVPFLNAYLKALGCNEYYEQVLSVITMLETPVLKAKRLEGVKWYEIDDEQDLNIAESMFADETHKYSKLSSRYGGYWRYPGMLDFCYLVNPYFPPKRLIEELKASFSDLLINYPSGMDVISLVGAKNFGLHAENVAVGNGAAELIKSLLSNLSGRTGFIRPTFEEYVNRYDTADSVIMKTGAPDYSYTADDVINFFKDKALANLVIINPDNPTGNYLAKAEVEKLISWTGERGINLVLDESFLDFVGEMDASCMIQACLVANPHLYVVKSISKSYGVPGLRLGLLSSGNTKMIATVKKDVAIWNINSFAEYFLQIMEKYKKDYAAALELFGTERERFFDELKTVKGLRVLPSKANYFMIEVSGITAGELAVRLLNEYNILIKNLSHKLDGANYIRVAIRNTEDNDRLLSALRELCGSASV